jgi:hypothetical protein
MVNNHKYFLTNTLHTIICTLIFFFTYDLAVCQTESYEYFYRIYFKDKGDNYVTGFEPEELLSGKAIKRRQKAGVSLIDYRDLPVYYGYIEQVSSKGLEFHCSSKWMNTGLFKSHVIADLSALSGLPFIHAVKPVRVPSGKSIKADKLHFETYDDGVTSFDRPITMINGNILHNSGYRGKGVLIAVIDGGFYNTDVIESLAPLRKRDGIVATYDFIENDKFVYGYHNHGTAVLSVLAGNLPGKIAGSAPEAGYMLLRSEDTTTEYPAEEDYWASAAEYADSAGADIITSSLGYYNFNNPIFDYKYTDMNGKTAFITRVADIAASKGILVICSAGNERDNNWQRIIAPADGDSVLAVGAVDRNNQISTFSSAGPSADGRIKPDNVTMGVAVPVQVVLNAVVRSDGTSFSCPVLSGMAACLIQAVPQAGITDIINTLHMCADRYNSPDSLYGYGIPDFAEAVISLQEKYISKPEKETTTGPNPFTDDILITFREVPGYLWLEIYSLSGQVMVRRYYTDYIGRELVINDLNGAPAGMYMVKLTTGKGVFIHKVIKISR